MSKFLVEMNEDAGEKRFTDLEAPVFIEVTEGPYKGVCFNFEDVKFHEVADDDGSTRLEYSLDLIFVPEGITLQHDNLGDFAGTSNEILLTILEDSLWAGEEMTDEDRNADSE